MQTTNLRIEQVELIRRLRNSGVSLQQITEAYQVFDRLDNEFGSFGAVKVTQSFNQIPGASNHVQARSPPEVQRNFMSHVTLDNGNDPTDRKRNVPSANQNNSAQTSLLWKNFVQNQSKFSQSREGLLTWSPEAVNKAKSSLFKKGDGRHVGLNDNNSPFYNSSPDTGTSRPTNYDQRMSSPCHDDSVSWNLSVDGSSANGFKTLPGMVTSESALREAGRCMLLSATSTEIVDLIRKCSMTVGDFDPCQLCTVHGLSHAELSKILNGHIPHDGDRALQVVDWFVNILIKTEWFISDVLRYSQQITTPKHTEVADVDFIPRRERFTFRDVHLEVMESHFKIDHYPSQKEKEMIANECNIKMAMASNCELTEKERATHINVDHWFRNKRKEMIRRAKLEKVDANGVSMPTPAKSPRKMIDSNSTLSEGFADKEGYYSTLSAAQPLHAFTSSQASELDKPTSSLAVNGENQMFQVSPTQRRDKCSENQNQLLNPMPTACTDDKPVPVVFQSMEEVGQAVSSNVTKFDIKIEPPDEEQSNNPIL